MLVPVISAHFILSTTSPTPSQPQLYPLPLQIIPPRLQGQSQPQTLLLISPESSSRQTVTLPQGHGQLALPQTDLLTPPVRPTPVLPLLFLMDHTLYISEPTTPTPHTQLNLAMALLPLQ